jgi:FSR family fosmidomycin resistance protein-like MFS transporter
MKSKPPSPAWTRITLLSFGHLLNDGYGSFFAPLLPLLINRLDLSLAMAGLAGTLHIALSAFTQPALGYLLDRTQRLSLVVIGPFLTICS